MDKEKDGLKEGQAKVLEDEKEYTEAWAELDKAEGEKDGGVPLKPAESDDAVEGLPARAPNEDAATADKKPVSETYGSVEAMEKSIKDTKSALTRVQMEKADLEQKLAAFEKGRATSDDVDAARKAVQSAQDSLAGIEKVKAAVYEDYPEFKELIDPLIDLNKNLAAEINTLRAGREANEKREELDGAYEHFNTHVRPKVLISHPDFDSVLTIEKDGKKVRNDEYFEWAEIQRPALRFAAMGSNDPDDIISAVTEFKKFKASPEAEVFRKKKEKQTKEKITNSQTLRGGSMPFPAGSSKAGDPEDYNSGWDEAGSLLKKQGID